MATDIGTTIADCFSKLNPKISYSYVDIWIQRGEEPRFPARVTFGVGHYIDMSHHKLVFTDDKEGWIERSRDWRISIETSGQAQNLEEAHTSK